jgi:hypothetical protein
MKEVALLGISLLAVSACAPQAPPPPPAAPASVSAPAGSPTNTTAAFDGSYDRSVVTAKTPAGCPDLSLPPYLVIQNGLATLQGYNLTFQGYVNPQGALTMTSGFGQTFQGQIDPQFNIRARVTGRNCAYDMTWSRVS